jgi:chemotaxis protein methyltransferase CheR
MFNQQFSDANEACALAQAIVDTVREPLVVLNHELRVVAASRSFMRHSRRRPVTSLESHCAISVIGCGTFRR